MKLKHISVVLLFSGVLFAANDAVRRLHDAAEVITEVMGAADKAIPQDLFDKAECLVVVPGVKKVAFIGGAKYGRGFISCRRHDVGGWSAPAAVKVEGGSAGFQIGISETDVIMAVMNRRGADKLLESKFTLGADASVAGGPVGRTTSADTDAQMQAEILTWSRTRGAFAGIALDGATLRPDDDTNKDLYGTVTSNREVIEHAKPPAGAQELLDVLNKYSSHKG
ncbi:MAG: lipid-binding SYLF domain-containing protein [Bryobacteraceae bacterium]|jgi:lipid-binding SYLF domain-containing protein